MNWQTVSKKSVQIRGVCPVVNVCDMGAIGDGESHPLSEKYSSLVEAQFDYPHATDLTNETDWAAIQAAINAVNHAGKVCIPTGTYRLGTSGLILNGSVILEGGGNSTSTLSGGTRLIYKGSEAALQVNDGSGVTTHNFVIRDLVIDCDRVGDTGIALGAPVGSPTSAGGMIENVTVTQAAAVGIKLVSSQLNQLTNVRCTHGVGDGFVTEPRLADKSPNTSTLFINCHAKKNGKRGVYFTQLTSSSWLGGSIEENGEEGILLHKLDDRATNNLIFDNIHIEQNNDGRECTGQAQVSIVSDVNQIWQEVMLRNLFFVEAGEGNYHINWSKARGTLWFPYFQTPAQTAILFDNTTSAQCAVFSEDEPATTLVAGATARVTVNRPSQAVGNGAYSIYTNDNGTFVEVWQLSAAGAATPRDVELLNADAGVILRSPSNNRYRVTVDDNGSLETMLL